MSSVKVTSVLFDLVRILRRKKLYVEFDTPEKYYTEPICQSPFLKK